MACPEFLEVVFDICLVADDNNVVLEQLLYTIIILYDSENINSCQIMTTFVLKRTIPYNDYMCVIPFFRLLTIARM